MLRLVVALLLMVVMVTACDDPAKSENSPFRVNHVDVDGRSIPCITWSTYDSWTKAANSGISCDWSPQ